MSLKDELDNALSEKHKNDAQLLSDNEVYEIMIKAMYKKLIVNG